MTRQLIARAAAAAALLVLALAAASPEPAVAAGIERVVPTVRPLFRDGTYGEFNLAHIRPELRGRDAPVLGLTGRTNNLFESYEQVSLYLKGPLTDRMSYMLSLDEPWGAATRYGAGTFPVGPGLPYAGTFADLESYAFQTLLAYDVTPNVKVYGGVRAQSTEASAAIPFIGPDYTIETNRDVAGGYMLGAAYQIPEIALNVSLTYYSTIRQTFDIVEFGTFDSELEVDFPESVNLEFQSGVAADTLVFGSVRWVRWSEFEIAPEQYVAAVGAPLVAYENDWWTYTLGVGRRFTPEWAGAFQVLYEPAVGGVLTTLGPFDGRTALTASATYTLGTAEITGGVTYGWLGSAANQLGTEFRDGTYFGVGLRLGRTF